jgi:endonuclease/exonuclease/phosphatase family metal-dependent hydrolase
VHGEFTEHTQWAIEDRPRVAHAARVVDRNGDRTVTIAHLHGLRDSAGKADTPARHAQAKRLRTLVKDASAPGDFVAVCGDMNLLPDSETFDTLGELGLVDLVGDADTRTSLYKKPTRSANYFLVSDPDAVRSFSTPAYPEVSDHRPLILTI